MILDVAWGVVKTMAGVGVVGVLVSLAAGILKQASFVRKMHLDGIVDQLAGRIVAYVQDVARETGASGAEQREQAVKTLTEKTGIDAGEAEERIRAAYQKMKGN